MAKKLMVIDDESGVCDILNRLFTAEGYEVKFDTDPLKAMEILKTFKPDCVLLDIKLPGADGVDLLAKIKKQMPGTAVVMITGYGDLNTAIESMRLGASDYITKPFDLDFIKTVVANCIAKKN